VAFADLPLPGRAGDRRRVGGWSIFAFRKLAAPVAALDRRGPSERRERRNPGGRPGKRSPGGRAPRRTLRRSAPPDPPPA
jgi:hypothetical protein